MVKHFLRNIFKPKPDRRETFERIYALDLWNGGSGPGSTPEATELYRDYLQAYMSENKVESIVDLGCGDWQFSKLLDFSKVHYLGFDIVANVVQKNQKIFGKKNIQFIRADLVALEVPNCDLIISKDVFQHLSNTNVSAILEEALKAGNSLLITNDFDHERRKNNIDIQDGGYRAIDLTANPFNLNARTVLEWNANGFLKRTVLISSRTPND